MDLFRTDNTDYTQAQLDALNQEWQEIVAESGYEEYTDEYNELASRFSDAVARR